MTDERAYDVVVIGSGVAGIEAALDAGTRGLRAALVCSDEIPGVGHYTDAELPIRALHAVVAGEADWPTARASYIRSAQAACQAAAESLSEAKVDILRGRGYVESNRSVVLLDPHTGDEIRSVSAKTITVAVGGAPDLTIVRLLDHLQAVDVPGFMELPALPATACILGGGPEALELAYALGRLGVSTTLGLTPGPVRRALSAELRQVLQARLGAVGVKILEAPVPKDNKANQFANLRGALERSDCRIVCDWSRARTGNLGIGKLKVAINDETLQILCDKHGWTSSPAIRAVGRCATVRDFDPASHRMTMRLGSTVFVLGGPKPRRPGMPVQTATISGAVGDPIQYAMLKTAAATGEIIHGILVGSDALVVGKNLTELVEAEVTIHDIADTMEPLAAGYELLSKLALKLGAAPVVSADVTPGPIPAVTQEDLLAEASDAIEPDAQPELVPEDTSQVIEENDESIPDQSDSVSEASLAESSGSPSDLEPSATAPPQPTDESNEQNSEPADNPEKP